jgi:D-3-phosphoglycerate dehydrogenase
MGDQPTILATGPIDQVAIDILSPFGKIHTLPNGEPESILPLVDNAIGIAVRGGGSVNQVVIAAAEKLRVIGRTGVGLDNVDLATATKLGIPVVYTPAAGASAVAEGAMAYMLALCKQLNYWDKQLKNGNWVSREKSRPTDLYGAILGILGLGNIGQTLAQLAHPFGMTLLAYDPYVASEKASELGIKLVGLDDLLTRADFISIHTPLIPETMGLINREKMKLVKKGSYLVNLARGGIIDSLDTLHEALLKGTLAGVGLDVFDPEPPDVSHPIFRHPNCLTSPHALGMTEGAMSRIFKSMAEDMAAVLQGDRPRFVANPEVFQNT